MNGLVARFSPTKRDTELSTAKDLISSYEKNSIIIYDRLYGGYPVMSAHREAGSHFIIRLKTSGKIPKKVKSFLQSERRETVVKWESSKDKTLKILVRLIKFINPHTRTRTVIATSLMKKKFSVEEIFKLYQKRWEIETSFRDLTHTLKAEQWHAENGILQEIYTLLWFMNNVKAQMMSVVKSGRSFLAITYRKSNFKLCANLVRENLYLLLSQQEKKFRELMSYWIRRTTEKRKHYSRNYDRILKGRLTKYPVRSKVPRRPSP